MAACIAIAGCEDMAYCDNGLPLQAVKTADNKGDLALHLAARGNASEEVLRLVAKAYPDAIEVSNHEKKLPFELSQRTAARAWFAQLAAYLGRYVLQNGARVRARARVQTRVKTRAKADRFGLQSN